MPTIGLSFDRVNNFLMVLQFIFKSRAFCAGFVL